LILIPSNGKQQKSMNKTSASFIDITQSELNLDPKELRSQSYNNNVHGRYKQKQHLFELFKIHSHIRYGMTKWERIDQESSFRHFMIKKGHARRHKTRIGNSLKLRYYYHCKIGVVNRLTYKKLREQSFLLEYKRKNLLTETLLDIQVDSVHS